MSHFSTKEDSSQFDGSDGEEDNKMESESESGVNVNANIESALEASAILLKRIHLFITLSQLFLRVQHGQCSMH